MRVVRSRALPGALIAAALLLAAPVARAASDAIVGSAGNVYTGATGPDGSFTLDAGSVPIFTNDDQTASHNVVSTDEGPDGERLFTTPLIRAGVSEPVDGAQYLAPGAYRFLCTIHIGMEGMLSVAGAGTVPRPAVDVSIASTKLRKVAKGKLEARITAQTASEDVSVEATLGRKVLASATGIDLAAGEARPLTLKLDRRARRLLDDVEKAKVTATAGVPFGAPDSAKRTLK